LRYLSRKLIDLPSVKQKLPWASWFVIIAIALGVVGDMSIKQPQLTILRVGIRFANIYLTVTNGLDLVAGKNNASLNTLTRSDRLLTVVRKPLYPCFNSKPAERSFHLDNVEGAL